MPYSEIIIALRDLHHRMIYPLIEPIHNLTLSNGVGVI